MEIERQLPACLSVRLSLNTITPEPPQIEDTPSSYTAQIPELIFGHTFLQFGLYPRSE